VLVEALIGWLRAVFECDFADRRTALAAHGIRSPRDEFGQAAAIGHTSVALQGHED